MPLTITAPEEFVTLRNGFTVLLPALQLAWRLEDRGCFLRVADDGVGLLVGPRRLVTDIDRQCIRVYRDELIALVRYECAAVQ
ncbi:MAG: hypothetical protein HYX76_10145 [Acidobacteria bacterium]|nr:hypothetical protein [Acidobacteriota bacterium]